jgi:hypothetical protein
VKCTRADTCLTFMRSHERTMNCTCCAYSSASVLHCVPANKRTLNNR